MLNSFTSLPSMDGAMALRDLKADLSKGRGSPHFHRARYASFSSVGGFHSGPG